MKVKPNFSFSKSLPSRCRIKIRRAVWATLKALPLKVRQQLKSKATYSLNVSLVRDPQMKKLNAYYRGKNKTTDVLAFSQLEGIVLPSATPEIGDVIISLPQAKRQAKEYGLRIEDELARLTIHGVLHLFGYDHEKNKKEEKRMFRLQDKIFEKVTR